MKDLSELLAAPGNIYIERSGLATCADIAAGEIARGRTVVLAANTSVQAHELSSLVRLFIPALSSGDRDPALPYWQSQALVFPEIRRLADRSFWSRRLSSFYGLYLSHPACVIAPMRDLLFRAIPRDFFASRVLSLSPGMDISPELVIDQAIEWGYERTNMVAVPGELASRGDILDIYASGYKHPFRLEFFGDQLEEIRLFDADTQRSINSLPEVEIIPASAASLAPKARDEVAKRFKRLESEGKLSENEAYSLRKKLEEGGSGICPGLLFANSSFFEEWLPEETLWILQGESKSVEAFNSARENLKQLLEDPSSDLAQPASLALRRRSHPLPWNGAKTIFNESLRVGVEEKGIKLPEKPIHSFAELFPLDQDSDRPWQTMVRAIKEWQTTLDQTIFAFPSDRSRKKFAKLVEQDGIIPFTRYAPDQKGVFALVSPFKSGARLEWAKIIALGEEIVFPRASAPRRKKSSVFKGLDNFAGLKPGDLLVHRDYGIGRFQGLSRLKINDAENDFLLLEYSGADKLYVPVDRLGLIQIFKGQEGAAPVLDRLGTQSWVNGKEKARKAIEKIAQDLVEMYAYRKIAKSFHYDPPGELYREFEATFNFDETPDQARAITEVIEDMDKPSPMDRLLCGDVGFGKTEVAMRAAFRAACEGRQVALLCPTTVLAEQHYQTFKARLAGFPINVGLLSRFVPRAKQKEVLAACEQGQIDILVGTHRILSNDVKLPNLSLLILDEEQRFGVRHKEKLKSMKKNVDVLTLTATPIPRTLQLSMSGIRDLSIIETAPVDRKPVASALIQRDAETLKKIIDRELAREGQVFWVYNRVRDLERVAEYVRDIAPNARVAMAHGQMSENELETTMRKFWHGEIDVLVSTSIVESGLDFPRANTLIVDQAQMFGLGQLYQLRGRVGRSDRQAYAYFLVPDPKKLTDIAGERLRIILDMDYLGAGFQVAMEDLRLRGAGNILGEAQSGHITRVGLDLYLEMLEEEVAKIKGEVKNTVIDPEMTIGVTANIPETYIQDSRERLKYYKILSSTTDSREREETALDLRDRFGPFPEELKNFLAILDFKTFIGKQLAEKAEIHADTLKLQWNKDQTTISPESIVRLLTEHPEIKLVPPAGLRLPLRTDIPFPDALKEAEGLIGPLAENVEKV
ncbi:MAG: transcription-repair coupling factor [Desulfovibrio sp.]|nr:transcription-repair coupling factor [Desulfovibrio sp.]